MSGSVDWNLLAARVQANYAATGRWYLDEGTTPPASDEPGPADGVDWNALAAKAEANFARTGQWYVEEDPAEPPAPGPTAPPETGPTPPDLPPPGAGPTAPSSPSPQPPLDAIAAPPGHSVVLSDDFSNGYLHANWGDPFPLPYPTGSSWNGGWFWNPADVAVRDGEMQVTMTRQEDGTWTAGGFNSFRAEKGIHYGIVEFDARVEGAQGTTAALLMWPMDDTWPPEIDILETPTNRPMHVLHWDDGQGGDDASVKFGGPDPSEWHRYRLTWQPDSVVIETDGEVVAQWDYNAPDVPMGFGAMGFVGTPRDGWMGGAPDETTPPVVTIHIDNVLMAQWDGIA